MELHSSINGDHLHFFKFIGRVVGNVRNDIIYILKALYDEFLFDAFFTRSEYFKNLTWILENDISELGLNFSINVNFSNQNNRSHP